MRTIWRLVGSGLVLLAGCGPSRALPDPGAGAGSGAVVDPARASDAAARNPAGCPATYGAVHVGASCTDTELTCGFPAGRCWCGPRAYCGGAAPPPEVLAQLAEPGWQCEPIRTDGCPEVQPSGACATPGKVCSYGDCCFHELTCERGTWTRTGGGCPP